ncbi:helix-turn-helix domain-containing protein [Deinococcus sp.]|uniref:helix-turn-helix domain-containing protein n=1 Tax=Deinococcus sp. TaxID=47478 RepID=UPI0025DAFB04|nr:helix-turn-helix domain-containing protein [Deinococcus sp.]
MNLTHPAPPVKLTYKPEELPPMLGIGRNGIYGLIHSGKLRSIRVGRKFVVPSSAIEEFLNGGTK